MVTLPDLCMEATAHLELCVGVCVCVLEGTARGA